jgi:hypothetical protein
LIAVPLAASPVPKLAQAKNDLYALFRLAMGTVAAAEATILLELQPVGRLLLIFLCVVVAALAFAARHHNHDTIFFFCHLSLPRDMK